MMVFGITMSDDWRHLSLLAILFALIVEERLQREKQALWLTRALFLSTGAGSDPAKQEDLRKLFSRRTNDRNGQKTAK